MSRIRLLSLAACIALPAFAPIACAQDFPSKPLRILIPYPTGGTPDIVGRPIAAAMSRDLGQPVVVDNKAGGGGVPAIQDMKNAPADGHTLFLADSSQWGTLPAVQPNLPYDPVRDFAAVGTIYSNVMFFFVNANSNIKSMKDIVVQAKAKPGSLRYGISGVGGIMHMAGEAFASMAGVKVTVVPFRGTPESIREVMNGDLDYAVSGGNPTFASMVKAGKLRAIATTGPQRDRYNMEIPSVNESAGISGYNLETGFGLVARSGTPRPVIDRLARALAVAQKDGAYLDALKRLEYNPLFMSPDEFAAKIRVDLEKYTAIARAGNIRIE